MMRKKVTGRTPQTVPAAEPGWLKLEDLAQVEVTSEDPDHPIESAFKPGTESGWRAAFSGQQVIRLILEEPQQVARIRLRFMETKIERTQEFVLRWSSNGSSFQEIVRQQWNFNPTSSIQEIEDYHVSLAGVAVLELSIIPDKSGGDAHASLADFRLA